MAKRIGVIINNIGTPEASDRRSVGRYLGQFLMDPGVIRLPWLFRFLLVRGLIVPFRSRSSALKYQAIWTSEGSPLKVISQRFADKLQAALGPNYQVELGMNYGTPSITDALERLRDCSEIIFCPMFPQYDASTTQAAVDKFTHAVRQMQVSVPTETVEAFYFERFFLEHFAHQLNKVRPKDYVLFSFHGLPEKYLDCEEKCPALEKCRSCYRNQCYQTAEMIAKIAGLAKNQWSVSFQSRLGPTKWLGPYTDHELERLAGAGHRTLYLASPAFVADCLETLEELNIESRKSFLSAGGERFHLLECPNDQSQWVEGFAEVVRNKSLANF